MKFKFLAIILAAFMSLAITGCGDGDDSNSPTPIEQPDNGNNGNGNDDGNDNPTPIPWALIRLEKHHDTDDPQCIRPNVDIMIIQENGRFHLEECDGVKDGKLTRTQLHNVRTLAARWLRTDHNRRICAESSPQSETYFRMTMDTGADLNIYEELTAQGLCSNGDRGLALRLYNTVLRAFRYHDIPSPVPEPQPEPEPVAN